MGKLFLTPLISVWSRVGLVEAEGTVVFVSSGRFPEWESSVSTPEGFEVA
jgi:hypothetical protein